MNQKTFHSTFINRILLLDGATGTNLQATGMPAGVSPEKWILEHPEVLEKLQEDFYEAGSTIVYAFTFGANRIKLESHGLVSGPEQVESINTRLAKISCGIRDKMKLKYPERDFYVAGDLAPTGSFLMPAGDLDFDDLVEIYREQVRGLMAAGVDLFVAETMMDMAQTRAAVLAVREETDMPVIASVTVDDNGRTLSGNSFEVCLLSLAAAGAQAVGMNCSSGPLTMAENLRFDAIPSGCLLLAKPNAGVPKLSEDGKTVFDLLPDDFAAQMMSFIKIGVSLIGGCCGTTPAHISALSDAAANTAVNTTGLSFLAPIGSVLKDDDLESSIIASQRFTCKLANWRDWPVLECTDISTLTEDILDIIEDEPEAIQIKFDFDNMPDKNEFKEVMAELQLTCSRPIIFRSDDNVLQHWIVRYFQGLTAIISDQISTDLSAYRLLP